MRGWAVLLLTLSLRSQAPLMDGFSHAEGLTNDAVRCIAVDTRGFMWFGTGDGVSRCDGRRFTGYGMDQGLAATQIDAIAAGADGSLALGMHGPWIARYDPMATPVFRSTRLPGNDFGLNVCAICVGGGKELWFTTEAGLFRAPAEESDGDSFVRVLEDDRRRWYTTIARSSRGEITYFSTRETAVIGAKGIERYPRSDAHVHGNVWSALELAPDQWLVLEDRALVEVGLQPSRSARCPLELDADDRFTCLCRDGRGGYWLGTTSGLRRLGADPSGRIRESMRVLDGEWIRAVELDPAGNLWIAGNTRGLVRRSGLPFTEVTLPDVAEAGLPVILRATRRGLFGICDRGEVVTARGNRMVPLPLDPELRPRMIASRSAIDGAGNLWLAAENSLAVFPLDGSAPESGVTAHRWPIEVDSFRSDSRGRVFGRSASGGAFVVDPADGSGSELHIIALPAEAPRGPVVWVDEDRRAWLATDAGLVLASATDCRELHDPSGVRILAEEAVEDPRGGLWLLSRRRAGVHRVRAQHDDALDLDTFDLTGALPAGAMVRAIGDARGHLWIAGASGMIDLDPEGGEVRRLRWPYRVVVGYVNSLAIAADESVWIASAAGVFRFDSAAWLPQPEHTLFVDELSIAGVPVRLPDGGTDVIPDLVVPSNAPTIALHFVAPDFGDVPLRIQHRLLPIDTVFSQQEPVGSLRLAGLAAGDYRLEVRAAIGDSRDLGAQLCIALSVPQPFWRDPLVLLSAIVATVGLAFGLHRMRMRRLLGLERIRRRIAMDLHDELGSGLAQVAVLSEAAKRRDVVDRVGSLDGIASVARRLRASLEDIVWAVNPERDTLPALVHRLRDVAVSLFPEDSVRLRFRAPADDVIATIRMTPDRRRNLFLLGKEALTNCARHSRARTVTIDIEVDQRTLRLRIADDGVGFVRVSGGSGHGIDSMRARAHELDGSLRIDSTPARGTVVALEAPL